jgi:hypothetical protein
MVALPGNLNNERHFSAASLWEIAIRTSLARGNFRYPAPVRQVGMTPSAGAKHGHCEAFIKLLCIDCPKNVILVLDF